MKMYKVVVLSVVLGLATPGIIVAASGTAVAQKGKSEKITVGSIDLSRVMMNSTYSKGIAKKLEGEKDRLFEELEKEELKLKMKHDSLQKQKKSMTSVTYKKEENKLKEQVESLKKKGESAEKELQAIAQTVFFEFEEVVGRAIEQAAKAAKCQAVTEKNTGEVVYVAEVDGVSSEDIVARATKSKSTGTDLTKNVIQTLDKNTKN